MSDVIVIGAGPAGLRCAESLAKAGQRVTVIGAEPGMPYNRVALSNYLAGDVDAADLVTFSAERLASLGIAFLSGVKVTEIDRAAHMLRTDRGDNLAYARLVFATGSQAIRLPLPGADLPGVLLYRTRDEVNTMMDVAQNGGRAVVIGGGPIGIESALRATERGAKVVLVERVPRLMPGLLESGASAVLQRNLEVRGVQVFVGESVVSLAHGEKDSVVVALVNGQRLPADLVLLGIGAAPDVKLARAGGLPVGRSVIADANLQAAPGIFVAGDLCEANGRPARGAVKEAAAQGKLAGANAVASVTGGALQPFVPMTLALSLRCNGVELSVAGVPGGVGVFSERMDDGVQPEIYRGVTRRADSVVGVQMIGTREGFDEWAAKVTA